MLKKLMIPTLLSVILALMAAQCNAPTPEVAQREEIAAEEVEVEVLITQETQVEEVLVEPMASTEGGEKPIETGERIDLDQIFDLDDWPTPVSCSPENPELTRVTSEHIESESESDSLYIVTLIYQNTENQVFRITIQGPSKDAVWTYLEELEICLEAVGWDKTEEVVEDIPEEEMLEEEVWAEEVVEETVMEEVSKEDTQADTYAETAEELIITMELLAAEVKDTAMFFVVYYIFDPKIGDMPHYYETKIQRAAIVWTDVWMGTVRTSMLIFSYGFPSITSETVKAGDGPVRIVDPPGGGVHPNNAQYNVYVENQDAKGVDSEYKIGGGWKFFGTRSPLDATPTPTPTNTKP